MPTKASKISSFATSDLLNFSRRAIFRSSSVNEIGDVARVVRSIDAFGNLDVAETQQGWQYIRRIDERRRFESCLAKALGMSNEQGDAYGSPLGALVEEFAARENHVPVIRPKHENGILGKAGFVNRVHA